MTTQERGGKATSKNRTTTTTLINRVIGEFGKKILTLWATHQSHLGRVRHEETLKEKGLGKQYQPQPRRINVEAHEKRNGEKAYKRECLFLPKVNAWLLGNNNVRKGRVEGGDVVKQTTLSFTK